jgi:hypothetical protein
MFDVNPDAAKFYLKDLEEQVAASRLGWEARPRRMRSTTRELRWGSLVALHSRHAARVFASALRVAVTAIF